jgi:hypothetical protein
LEPDAVAGVEAIGRTSNTAINTSPALPSGSRIPENKRTIIVSKILIFGKHP